MRNINFQEGVSGVTSYDGEVMTNMFFVLVLGILEIRAFPSGRHVMIPYA